MGDLKHFFGLSFATYKGRGQTKRTGKGVIQMKKKLTKREPEAACETDKHTYQVYEEKDGSATVTRGDKGEGEVGHYGGKREFDE